MKTKKLSKFLTKQHNLEHRLGDVFFVLAFVSIFVVFTSELKRVVEFNRDKNKAQLIEVTAETCKYSYGSRNREALCYVLDSTNKRRYLGLDPNFFSRNQIKAGDRLMVYEFPDGNLENDLKISRSYLYLVCSAIGLLLYSSLIIYLIHDRYKKKPTKTKNPH